MDGQVETTENPKLTREQNDFVAGVLEVIGAIISPYLGSVGPFGFQLAQLSQELGELNAATKELQMLGLTASTPRQFADWHDKEVTLGMLVGRLRRRMNIRETWGRMHELACQLCLARDVDEREDCALRLIDPALDLLHKFKQESEIMGSVQRALGNALLDKYVVGNH
jgi:hypothetical protein